MLSAVLSFLGGSAFRMIWGEVSAWLNKKLDHEHEIERMKLQADLDAAQHARNLEAIRLQADMGVKVVHAQAEAALNQVEAEGWLEAVKATGRAIGVAWVDAWNAVIRPAVATWAVLMLTANELHWLAQPLSEGTSSVCYAALGIYLADRTLGKRGK